MSSSGNNDDGGSNGNGSGSDSGPILGGQRVSKGKRRGDSGSDNDG